MSVKFPILAIEFQNTSTPDFITKWFTEHPDFTQKWK